MQRRALNSHARATATAAFFSAGIALNVLGIPAAQAQEQYPPGIWHYRSVACVNTTVKSVQPRLVGGDQTKFTSQDFETGVEVVFNTHLGNDAAHPGMLASVTLYGGLPETKIMQRERPGDRVQVCFLSRPAPTVDCNPDEDVRGRIFRVYDVKQHAQYSGQNTEHSCGGA
jgi:hypothetical protein